MQPGDTITPQNLPDQDKPADDSEKTINISHDQPAEPTQASQFSPTESEKPPVVAPVEPEKPTSPIQDVPASPEPAQWQFSHDESLQEGNYSASGTGVIDWTASEFIDHEKSANWYTRLGIITAAAVTLAFLITRDLVTAVAIIVAAGLFGYTAKRKPRTLQYQISQNGINVDGKNYPYGSFKSFSVLVEGAISSIQLMPLKRFMPPLSLYFPPDEQDNVINTLGSYLPNEQRAMDPVDRLMRRVRF